MKYLVEGLISNNGLSVKVEANTPLEAIKILLSQNKLKGKISKVTGRGNCTVTSLGQRKVTTNFYVTNLVPNVPKKKAFCIVVYDCRENKEVRTFEHFLYNGSAEQFVAECRLEGNSCDIRQTKYWGKSSYSVYVDNLSLDIIEIQGTMPKAFYLLYANCVLARVRRHSTGDGEESVFNETFDYFGSETKRKSAANALIKTYKAQICKYIGKATYKNQNRHMWLYKDALDCLDTDEDGFMEVLDKDGSGRLGLYNVIFITFKKPSSCRDILSKCFTRRHYYDAREMYEYM